MTVLAIDPGPVKSAFVVLGDNDELVRFGKLDNRQLIWDQMVNVIESDRPYHMAIEMVASYGMSVGADVFVTCVWTGRLIEAWGGTFDLVYRKDVKLHLCGQARANDSNVRQALIDRYGGKGKAIGKKASPGPLHGVKADVWQALAIAVTWSDMNIRRAA